MRWFIGLGLAIWLLAGQAQLVSAQGFTPCAMSAVTSSLAPEWVAIRQQYETTYQPITTGSDQANCSRSRSESALAPEWVAVRQQYETTYQPITTGNVQANCSPLAPEWVAVRQQYEHSYVPLCQG